MTPELQRQNVREGINLEYVEGPGGSADDKKVAVALCKLIKAEGYAASAKAIPSDSPSFPIEWVASAPHDAVVIKIGPKPNRFWEVKEMRANGYTDDVPDMNFCSDEEQDEWWQGHLREIRKKRLENPK